MKNTALPFPHSCSLISNVTLNIIKIRHAISPSLLDDRQQISQKTCTMAAVSMIWDYDKFSEFYLDDG